MFLIKENENNNIGYTKTSITNNGEIIYSKVIEYTSANVTVDNKVYRYLYDSDMIVVSNVFRFINFNLTTSSSINHIFLALTSLKLLYCYLDIFHLNLKSLTIDDVKKMVLFLKGESIKGVLYNLDLKTKRSDNTINLYLSIYRKYVEYLGLDNSVFLKKNQYKMYYVLEENQNQIEGFRYETSVKSYKNTLTTPKYISIKDFKSIISIIRTNYTIREECIVRLMFESGLRIGEVLGLTNEDILETDTGANLYIRNRLSDSTDQLAKTCMNVSNYDQYLSSSYKTKGYGYQIVSISSQLMNLINDYVNEFHMGSTKIFQDNYSTKNTADIVTNKYNDTHNFYLFINSIGKPLSVNLWNITLRKIFSESNILVDKEKRENNLNHRFRHGFAMFLVKHKHKEAYEVMELLRQRNINSVLYYYNPTDEDTTKIKTEITNSIYELLPELTE